MSGQPSNWAHRAAAYASDVHEEMLYTTRREKRSKPIDFQAEAKPNSWKQTGEARQPGRKARVLCVAAGSSTVVQVKTEEELARAYKPALQSFGLGGHPMVLQSIMQANTRREREQELSSLQLGQPRVDGLTAADLPGASWLVSDALLPHGTSRTIEHAVRLALADDGFLMLAALDAVAMTYIRAHGLLKHAAASSSQGAATQQSGQSDAAQGKVLALRIADGFDQLLGWARSLRAQYAPCHIQLLVPNDEDSILAVWLTLAVCDPHQAAFPLDSSVWVVDGLQGVFCQGPAADLTGAVSLRFGTPQQPADPPGGSAPAMGGPQVVQQDTGSSLDVVEELQPVGQVLQGSLDVVDRSNVATIMEDVEYFCQQETGQPLILHVVSASPLDLLLRGPYHMSAHLSRVLAVPNPWLNTWQLPQQPAGTQTPASGVAAAGQQAAAGGAAGRSSGPRGPRYAVKAPAAATGLRAGAATAATAGPVLLTPGVGIAATAPVQRQVLSPGHGALRLSPGSSPESSLGPAARTERHKRRRLQSPSLQSPEGDAQSVLMQEISHCSLGGHQEQDIMDSGGGPGQQQQQQQHHAADGVAQALNFSDAEGPPQLQEQEQQQQQQSGGVEPLQQQELGPLPPIAQQQQQAASVAPLHQSVATQHGAQPQAGTSRARVYPMRDVYKEVQSGLQGVHGFARYVTAVLRHAGGRGAGAQSKPPQLAELQRQLNDDMVRCNRVYNVCVASAMQQSNLMLLNYVEKPAGSEGAAGSSSISISSWKGRRYDWVRLYHLQSYAFQGVSQFRSAAASAVPQELRDLLQPWQTTNVLLHSKANNSSWSKTAQAALSSEHVLSVKLAEDSLAGGDASYVADGDLRMQFVDAKAAGGNKLVGVEYTQSLVVRKLANVAGEQGEEFVLLTGPAPTTLQELQKQLDSGSWTGWGRCRTAVLRSLLLAAVARWVIDAAQQEECVEAPPEGCPTLMGLEVPRELSDAQEVTETFSCFTGH